MIKIFLLFTINNEVICKYIFVGVIRNAHASVKDEHISTPIKIWLAHAKERISRIKGKERERESEERQQQ